MAKYRLKFRHLLDLVERDVGISLNTCLLWGRTTITTKQGYFEQAKYLKLEWLGKKSFRDKPNPRANGHVVTVNDIPNLIQHYVKRKELPFGEYEVVP